MSETAGRWGFIWLTLYCRLALADVLPVNCSCNANHTIQRSFCNAVN